MKWAALLLPASFLFCKQFFMIEYKNLNNISPKLKESIPPMKGEVVFQMLNGHKNNDMDRTEREKEPILYGKTQIPTFAKIRDPFANEGKGATVNIGVPMSFDINGNATAFKPFLAGLHEGKFNGKFSLHEGKIEDEELYEVFWLLNENASNPHRDKSVPALFKIVNYKEEAKSTFGRMDDLLAAIQKLKDMNDSDYVEFANSQNFSETNIDFIKAEVANFAKTYPDKFITLMKDPLKKVRSDLKVAINKGILTFDARTKEVAVNGNKIMTVSKEDSENYIQAIATWLQSAKNGDNIYAGILKQINQEAVQSPTVGEEVANEV
jgi:hypothetical protein